MFLDILLTALILLILFLLAVGLVAAYAALPLSDVLNAAMRKIGLAGPSPGVRATGNRATGTVAGPFTVREGEAVARGSVFVGGELWNAAGPAALAADLREGDPVEIVYNDDLTVTVLGKKGGSPGT